MRYLDLLITLAGLLIALTLPKILNISTDSNELIIVSLTIIVLQGVYFWRSKRTRRSSSGILGCSCTTRSETAFRS